MTAKRKPGAIRIRCITAPPAASWPFRPLCWRTHAAVTYTLDKSAADAVSSVNNYEIVYVVVDTEGNVVKNQQLTSDSSLDENPQITTAMLGGEEQFILGWHNVTTIEDEEGGQRTESDIRLASVDSDGNITTGEVNLACMALLDAANTEAYGDPVPVTVPLTIEKGPFIVVSGHDLHDLKLLLEQTEGKGINIYTHSEMLPAHGYPELKKYPHLKGNFGTGWQNQQTEFHNIPAPILFTTNCLMPVRQSYCDRVFTTSVVSYPEIPHIGADKDFTPVIEKALECGGYPDDHPMTGMNGGHTVTTGFARNAVLAHAGEIVQLVKSGKIRHIFLIGGCDGAAPSRSYYTDFARMTPADTLILTLACGKYRLNDMDLGSIGGIPRILDCGQCNDAYSAIRIAMALAEAFGCGVNDLPLTLVLSWYEQKAVAILLTLLALGVKNIHLGPSLPAFVSPDILNLLVENWGIKPISTPDEDLKALLG